MAEDADDASKTEEPTGDKINKAREEGSVAQSQEVKSLAMFIAAAIFLVLAAPFFTLKITQPLLKYIESPHAIDVHNETLPFLLVNLLTETSYILLPLCFFFLIVAVAASVGQTGLIWSPKKLAPKLSTIDPIKGWSKIFGVKQLMEVPKNLAKIGLAILVAAYVLIPIYEQAEAFAAFDVWAMLDIIHQISILLAIGVSAALVVVAALDYAWQRYTYMKDLRMTKQEVKDEHKQKEGDPQVKNKIKALRIERAAQRMMQNIPNADVVITNPTHYAVAMEYKIDEFQAPRVTAKGVDHIAAKIRELAEEHDVPIIENPPLTRALYATVELDQEIPPEHYKAVAEVIGYVMRLKGKNGG